MQLVIAEKPSVGVALAKALGVTEKKDGYIESNPEQSGLVHTP